MPRRFLQVLQHPDRQAAAQADAPWATLFSESSLNDLYWEGGSSMVRRAGIFLMVAAGLVSSVLVLAQQDTTPQTQGRSAAIPTRTAEITIRGCVTGRKRYTFMQASTGAMFALTGETSRFVPVRGKLVEITANEFAPRGNSGELPKLRVRNLQIIADKCPIQARAASRVKVPSANEFPPAAESPATAPYADPGTESQSPPNVNNPNISGDTGAPSPGTGNLPKPPQ
jgi:hypothetical protein